MGENDLIAGLKRSPRFLVKPVNELLRSIVRKVKVRQGDDQIIIAFVQHNLSLKQFPVRHTVVPVGNYFCHLRQARLFGEHPCDIIPAYHIDSAPGQ